MEKTISIPWHQDEWVALICGNKWYLGFVKEVRESINLDSLFQKYLCPQKVSHTMAKILEKKYVSMHIIYKINSQCNKNARRLENQKALYIRI